MGETDIDPALQAQITSLEAQRAALVASMDLHVRRSEEIAYQVQTIDDEILALRDGDA
jgi:hypothetical protein